MATINHPSMKRAGDNSVIKTEQRQTNFVVDNPTQDIDNHLEQFEVERPLMPPAEVFEREKVPVVILSPEQQEQKRRLEKLIFTGRQLKVVDILEHKFELSTVTNKEHQEMVKGLGDNVDLFKIRSLTLANALRTIDGIRLDDLTNKDNDLTDFLRRVDIIDNLQLALVEKLYEEYNNLLKENDTLISGASIKK